MSHVGGAIAAAPNQVAMSRLLESVATRPGNALANIVAGALALWLAFEALAWAVLNATSPLASGDACAQSSGACWPFLAAKYRLILFGRYPYDDQWRPALFLVLAVTLIVWTLLRALRQQLSSVGARTILIAWLVMLPVCAFVMAGGAFGLVYVSPEIWDGLPLTLILATLGSFGAFFLALPLALGRRSDMPIIRGLSTAYIEFVRGIPLVGFLFMAFVLSPLLLPAGWSMNSPSRALVVLVLFLAAYMAEVVRGALQNVPKGQYDAAATIGLDYWKTMRTVVLPQALQQALPSLANIFIGAIKDTSIVFTVGMLDLMGAADGAVNDPAWNGRFLEIYAFVAAIYLVMCGGVSRYSRALEKATERR